MEKKGKEFYGILDKIDRFEQPFDVKECGTKGHLFFQSIYKQRVFV